jgi:hypothetical protein
VIFVEPLAGALYVAQLGTEGNPIHKLSSPISVVPQSPSARKRIIQVEEVDVVVAVCEVHEEVVVKLSKVVENVLPPSVDKRTSRPSLPEVFI